MNVEQTKQQMLERGYVQIFEPGLADLIALDDFVLRNQEERLRDNGAEDIPANLRHKFDIVAQTLKAKYVDPAYGSSEYVKFIVWEGVDYDNQHWHTDLFEGYNTFFLLYFDDQHEDTGGAIHFKWGEGEEENTLFYPKRGDLFWISNKRGYFHRVDPIADGTRRRVASFDFNAEGF